MKEAVVIAMSLGDIREEAVCKGVGMNTHELRMWLNQKGPSRWDTKIAEWVKRTQSKAHEEASAAKKPKPAPAAPHGGSSTSVAAGKKSLPPPSAGKRPVGRPAGTGGGSSSAHAAAGPSSSAPPGKKHKGSQSKAAKEREELEAVKKDLGELEDYVPWGVVVPSWSSRRTAWAKKLKLCDSVELVGRQLVILEAALVPHALEAGWRSDGTRDDWRAEVLEEVETAEIMMECLREVEEQLKWRAFAAQPKLQSALSSLLAAPCDACAAGLPRAPGVPMNCPDASKPTSEPPDGAFGEEATAWKGSRLDLKAIRLRIDRFNYSAASDLVDELRRLAGSASAEVTPSRRDVLKMHAEIAEAFAPLLVASVTPQPAAAAGGTPKAKAGGAAPATACPSSANGARARANGQRPTPPSHGGHSANGSAASPAAATPAHEAAPGRRASEEPSEGPSPDLCQEIDYAAAAGSAERFAVGGTATLSEQTLRLEAERAGADRSRVIEKEAKYEQFKRQQRLHPE